MYIHVYKTLDRLILAVNLHSVFVPVTKNKIEFHAMANKTSFHRSSYIILWWLKFGLRLLEPENLFIDMHALLRKYTLES